MKFRFAGIPEPTCMHCGKAGETKHRGFRLYCSDECQKSGDKAHSDAVDKLMAYFDTPKGKLEYQKLGILSGIFQATYIEDKEKRKQVEEVLKTWLKETDSEISKL